MASVPNWQFANRGVGGASEKMYRMDKKETLGELFSPVKIFIGQQ